MSILLSLYSLVSSDLPHVCLMYVKPIGGMTELSCVRHRHELVVRENNLSLQPSVSYLNGRNGLLLTQSMFVLARFVKGLAALHNQQC